MERRITGFHQDEHGDWVAELDCCHGQHVRHKPPFFNRTWTQTEAGRAAMLGTPLTCVRCDKLEFPAGLHEYKRTPTFTETTIPAGLLRDHTTKRGVWGLIEVEAGTLLYTVQYPEERSYTLMPGTPGIVVPEMKHRVQALGTVSFHVAFYTRESNSSS
jgi:tellurite methyltransferase